jgi:hypothetical protein
MSKTKAVATVREVARLVGLSRARFYQLLQAGAFPMPARNRRTGRPYYTEQLQRICLAVRAQGRGVNGQPILFYTPRRGRGHGRPVPTGPRRRGPAHGGLNSQAALIDAVRALGLIGVAPTQVEAATRDLFPAGTAGTSPAQVIRAVFLRLKRQQRGV